MKNIILIFITIFFFSISNTLFSQEFWEKINFPDTLKIFSFDIYDNEIFVGTSEYQGSYGGLFKSDLTNIYWEHFLDTDNHTVGAIQVSEIGNIFITKSGLEKFFYSDTYGEGWQLINLPEYVNYGINFMEAHDLNTLYVGLNKNDGGLLLKTNDNGDSWDSLFSTNNHSNEYIADILITENDEIYLAMGSYLPDMGGIYYSPDNGETWQFLGLLNHSVSALAFNSNNDLFAAVRGAGYDFYPGVYILRNDSDIWESHLEGAMVEDLIINSQNHIFCSSSWPSGITRSLDNGNSFNWINSGLGGGAMGKMIFDQNEYIYTTTSFTSNSLYKSTKTTVNTQEIFIKTNSSSNIVFYPNPFVNTINIEFKNDAHKYTNLRIYNSFGIEVYQTKLNPNLSKLELNTKNLKPGPYLVHLKNNTSTEVLKIIKY